MDEVLNYFPELSEKIFNIIETIEGLKAKAKFVYKEANKLKSQKEFAQYVLKHTKLAPICFTSRKFNKSFDEVYNDMAGDFWVKFYEKL